ncbi:TetR/AcrR family transcriptional regulator [Tranquillimonas alkanivorans]|uniref:Transcriptional regulator, TetR family n=1 Tax=Tranquillimonas alkanivorans TaxID=441119 RepID=A0A1I5VP70_9RHOB|nr:TetR/AcrR family transcriptional regulator [Tranquillimonas alkanivorans]SFQ08816.1 transcriptional regulator, TetR family [Tranquillimonas alkanivorans]
MASDTEQGSARIGAGRPATMDREDRRAAILDALDAVFRRHGMSGVTMAALAREAGMSKRTLYEVFDDRAALFDAYLARLRRTLVRPLSEEELALPLAERLRFLLAPRPLPGPCDLPLAILRAVIAETPETPAMGRSMYDNGPRVMQDLIRVELDRAVRRGEADIADTDAAAALLRDMIRPNALDLLMCPDRAPSLEEAKARFELGLDIFLRAVTTPTGGSKTTIGLAKD